MSNPTALTPGAPAAVQPAETIGAGNLARFFQGALDLVCVEMDGRQAGDAAPPAAVVAGAFDPVHAGHWGLAAATEQIVGPAAFELCIANVDKPALSIAVVWQRLRKFAWPAPVWVTRAPTFVEKARLFPGAVFAVGADTAERILAPRYYIQGETGLATAMAELRRHGCRFLVACRIDASGRCIELNDLQVAAEYRDMFMAIPKEWVRYDLSSTQLRLQGKR